MRLYLKKAANNINHSILLTKERKWYTIIIILSNYLHIMTYAMALDKWSLALVLPKLLSSTADYMKEPLTSNT